MPNVISKNEMRKIERIQGIDNVYVVMDLHTIFHNSENLLSSLNKKYGEENVKLCVSLNNSDIPSELENNFNKKDENIIENIA